MLQSPAASKRPEYLFLPTAIVLSVSDEADMLLEVPWLVPDAVNATIFALGCVYRVSTSESEAAFWREEVVDDEDVGIGAVTLRRGAENPVCLSLTTFIVIACRRCLRANSIKTMRGVVKEGSA